MLLMLLAPSARLPLRDDGLVAAGTDAVAELHVRVLADVLFDLLPVVLIVADALAVAADRQEAVQLLHGRQGDLELRDAIGEALLELQHAQPHMDPRA